MGEGRAHYRLFFPSKENPDTQVGSHCNVVEVIHSRINTGISRITCCVSQNFWNSGNDEVECIINREVFFYEEGKDGENYHCQKFGTRWRLRLRTKVIMAAKSYKKNVWK